MEADISETQHVKDLINYKLKKYICQINYMIFNSKWYKVSIIAFGAFKKI